MAMSRRLQDLVAKNRAEHTQHPEPTPKERFARAMELYDLGCAMMRAKLRREHPEETDAQIEERFQRWHAKEDQLSVGDWGHVGPWPRQ